MFTGGRFTRGRVVVRRAGRRDAQALTLNPIAAIPPVLISVRLSTVISL
jgi:hypothetical protein